MPFPSLPDLSDPGMEPRSPALQADSLLSEPPGQSFFLGTSAQISISLFSCKMETHSSILVWRIPWTEESGGLQSMGSQRVGHD